MPSNQQETVKVYARPLSPCKAESCGSNRVKELDYKRNFVSAFSANEHETMVPGESARFEMFLGV